MEYFSEVKLSNNSIAQIVYGKGLHFFNALSKSNGDSGLMIKHLILELVIIDKSPLTESKLNQMEIKDVSYLSEVIGLLLSDKYRNGI